MSNTCLKTAAYTFAGWNTGSGTPYDDKASVENLTETNNGTISIVCTDKLNNTSAGVTVGAGLGANGIIIEDNAISDGIASISYKIGNGSEKTVAHDYTTS